MTNILSSNAVLSYQDADIDNVDKGFTTKDLIR